MKRQGFLDKAINYLKEGGMEVEVFEGVEPDPSVETVMRGAEAMRAFEPDWIVSMGGGSPIDAAKAMWAFYEYPDVTFEDLCIPFNFPKLRQKAKFAAIPTTSGTATEVTAFSVITNYQTGVKYPLADFNITPDVAIVDPELVEGLPAKQVAYTGMDALTHAIEAYVSTANCAFTDPLALQAIEMVFDYLPASYRGRYRIDFILENDNNQKIAIECDGETRSEEDLIKAMEFYDYIEVQPPENYSHLLRGHRSGRSNL